MAALHVCPCVAIHWVAEMDVSREQTDGHRMQMCHGELNHAGVYVINGGASADAELMLTRV